MLSICEICGKDLFNQNIDDCTCSETVQKNYARIVKERDEAEKQLRDIQDAGLRVMQTIQKKSGGQYVVLLDSLLSELWEALHLRFYNCQSPDQFVEYYHLYARVVCEARDLFRDVRIDSLGHLKSQETKMTALKEVLESIWKFNGWDWEEEDG